MTALLTSELRKVTTLRFWWALAIAPLAVALFSGAIFAAVDGTLTTMDAELTTSAANVGLFITIGWVALFAGLFGAVNAGTEFRYSTLTPTFLTSSSRDGVLAAKLIVTAAFGALYAIAAVAVAMVALMAFGGALEFDGTLLGLLGIGVLAAVAWSLIGAGLGLAFASSIGAAIVLLAWFPVGEMIVGSILAGFGAGAAGQWLPGALTLSTVLGAATDGLADTAPWPLAPVALLAWAALSFGLGWWLTRGRDVT
ncbi:ABC transporter permease [Rhodococcus sp. NPDC058514]|uniref:ABC transporter permease n=1 Tax=unclassified Rhodococcus (in: high G+C Gram-positive bacteria) TaxID=192944 RepID=UPI00365AE36E